MFGLKNHTNNLQYSQRIYYSNYQFYNDYDNPNNFPNDTSKITYNCTRKTTPIITKYNSTKHIHQQLPRTIQHSTSQPLTIDELLETFVAAFMENNYSDGLSSCREDAKNTYRVELFPLQAPSSNIPHLVSILLQPVLSLHSQAIKHILDLNEHEQITPEELEYYRYLLAFCELVVHGLGGWLKSAELAPTLGVEIGMFRTLVDGIINGVVDGVTVAHLLLYVPNTHILSYFIHPLLPILHNYLHRSLSLSSTSPQMLCPKIVFVNLDGHQAPLNLPLISTTPSLSLLYITIYTELEEINEMNDQPALWYSKFMAKSAMQANSKAKEGTNQNASNGGGVLAFPVRSAYVRNQWETKMGNGAANTRWTGSSQDIMFLFENVIYERLRDFHPHAIIISYNGYLNIEQSHFASIIRKLTILSDHRIVLFTNLSTLLCPADEVWGAVSGFFQSQSPIYSQEQDRQTLLHTLTHTLTYTLPALNIPQLFNNLAMFNKTVSGSYSLQQPRLRSLSEKYDSWYKYQYLETLATCQEYAYLKEHKGTGGVKGSVLAKLLDGERNKLLAANREQVAFYDGFFNAAIDTILNQPHKLATALSFTLKKMQSYFPTLEALKAHLNSCRKSLLVETITRTKQSHIIIAPPQGNEYINELQRLALRLRNKRGCLEPILVDSFMQVVTSREAGLVFCFNYMGPSSTSYWLIGKLAVHNNGNSGEVEVEMFVLRELSKIGETGLELNYSFCFDLRNRVLYLYWPEKWNLFDEATHLLLNKKYEPMRVHKIYCIDFSYMNSSFSPVPISELNLAPNNEMSIPRYGSTMYPKSRTQLVIFGGYYSSLSDYNQSTPITILHLNPQYCLYTSTTISKDRLMVQLRPKAGYMVTEIEGTREVCIWGGYGREFTNFYNIYSNIMYAYHLDYGTLRVYSRDEHVSPLTTPLVSSTVGNYDQVSFNSIAPTVSKQISTQKKQRYIMAASNPTNSLTFVTSTTEIQTHRPAPSSAQLMTLHNTISAIYTMAQPTPELFLGLKNGNGPLTRLELLAPVHSRMSNPQVTTNKQVLLNEDAIISMCFDQRGTSIFLLTDLQYVVYRAQLAKPAKELDSEGEHEDEAQPEWDSDGEYQWQIDPQERGRAREEMDFNMVLKTGSLTLEKFYVFGTRYRDLSQKRLCWWDNSLYLVGGQPNTQNIRQDYIITPLQGTTQAKTLILSCSTPSSLLLPSCFAMVSISPSCPHLLLYSIALQEQKNYLRIHRLQRDELTQQVVTCKLATCTVVGEEMFQIFPLFEEPFFSDIRQYSVIGLRELGGVAEQVLQLLPGGQQQMEYMEEMEDIGESEQNIKMENEEEANKNPINNLKSMLQRLTTQPELPNLQKTTKYLSMMSTISQSDLLTNSLITTLSTLHSLLLSLQLQHLSFTLLPTIQAVQLYKFVLEDRRHPTVKYVAIGELNYCGLVFWRVCFPKTVGVQRGTQQPHSRRSRHLVGSNLAERFVNPGTITDHKFVKYLIRDETESIHLSQLSPFDPQVEEHTIECKVVDESPLMAS